MAEIPTKPYLVRAIHAWCEDSGYRPYIAVVVDERTQVPREFVRNGEIVLNVSAQATNRLRIGNELIEFEARFSGAVRAVSIPIENVSAIYAQETGHGMAFDVVRTQAARPSAPDTASAASVAPATSGAPPELALAPQPISPAEAPVAAARRTSPKPKLVPRPAPAETERAAAPAPLSIPVLASSRPDSPGEGGSAPAVDLSPEGAPRKPARGGRRRAASPASADRGSGDDRSTVAALDPLSADPAAPVAPAAIARPEPVEHKPQADASPTGAAGSPPEPPAPASPSAPGRGGRGHLKRVK